MNPTHPPLRIAVVGHTNTGKTSLLRTLTRDRSFGEVADRPGVTRDVSGTALLVDGRTVAELYDTPGLEDSIGLWDHLLATRPHDREEGPDSIARFLNSPEAVDPFSQEAKAIRQLLESDIALYVIDARDRVLGKHRDELRILTLCARPLLPVLNFVVRPEARSVDWRQHLSRSGLHAVAEFDTVVVTEEGEQQLFEKIRTLLDNHRDRVDALLADRKRARQELIIDSLRRIADLLVQVAATRMVAPVEPNPNKAFADIFPKLSKERLPSSDAMDRLRAEIRVMEQRCVADLLAWHRFHPDDCEAGQVPVVDGHWGLDLFHAEALKDFGIKTTSAAAAGAMAGLALDVAVGGLSLGTAAMTGAALGALVSAGKSHGRRLLQSLLGKTELRSQDATIHLLGARQMHLLRALLSRGHASQQPVQFTSDIEDPSAHLNIRPLRTFAKGLPAPLQRARVHVEWSLATPGRVPGYDVDADREDAVLALATALHADL